MSYFVCALRVVGAVAVLAGLGAGSHARAAVIVVQGVTASSSYDWYGPEFATDGPDLLTDWATRGEQSGGYLRIDLGFAQPLGVVDVTDRVTSYAQQGLFGGETVDFTTSYRIQAYTDATFTTTIGPAVTNTEAVPAQPTSISSFQSTADLTGVTAQFIQYTILSSLGNNPGLEDITFNTPTVRELSVVPEPASMLALAFGLVLLRTVRRAGRA